MKPHVLIFVVMLAASSALASSMKVVPTSLGLEFSLGEGSPKVSVSVGEVVDVQTRGAVVYAALAAGGVVVVNAENPTEPSVVAKLAEGRRISKIIFSGNQMLLVETRQEVLAFDVLSPLSPVATVLGVGKAAVPAPVVSQPSTGPLKELTEGVAEVLIPSEVVGETGKKAFKVLQVLRGRVVFEAGAKEGFVEGQRVKIVSQKMVEKPDLVSGGTRPQPSNETTAVLIIEQSEDSRSMALLGRGDVAEAGDLAYVTAEALTERIFLPRRSPFNWRTGFHVRPFLGLGATGTRPVGFLADVYGAYYFDEVPLVAEVSMSPFGTVFGARDRHNPVTFAATLAYATDFVEVGLGVGALGGRAGPCTDSPWSLRTCESNTGFTINQVLRLGSVDGLNFLWRSSVFSREDTFVFGVGRGEINVPLNRRIGVFGGGGGGENGWNLGEVGVRSYIGGTGARGTQILSASLGIASIFDGPTNEWVSGPAVSFGWEWRL